ncbi:gamma-secretase aspartyl protease complex, presenilin enhancer-2 subunit [Chytriomyces sp. MP71]|nr:gamma-secretase aspartyl protease complex, presenilin enhancer-2 subunit [Chytriomyces sp. MP71]
MEPDEILAVARTYFWLGCAFLPFLWLVNFVYLYPVSRRRKAELPPSVHTYLFLSLGGSIFWTIVIFTWLGLYLTNRTKWGALGDRLSINLPLGY